MRLRRTLSVVLSGLVLAGVGWPIHAMVGALWVFARMGALPFGRWED